eukprot:15437963-Alexandrium_andersonii.AAC.1
MTNTVGPQPEHTWSLGEPIQIRARDQQIHMRTGDRPDLPWSAMTSELRDPSVIEADLREWERVCDLPQREVAPLAEPP